MTPDIDRITEIVAEVAAAEVMPRFRKLKTGEVQEKTGPHDLVTAADLASEAALTAALRDALPGSHVVGEEAVATAPGVMDRLEGEGAVWIVDPVDGTLNFTEGRRDFTVIVALVRDGATCAGWIHEPATGRTVVAEHGGGAREADGTALRVARPLPVERMVGALYVGKRRAPRLFERVKALQGRLGPRHYSRCAGAEHVAMARGRVHYAVFTRLMPWDHAAGVLIHAEAGGTGRLVSGRPYVPKPLDEPMLMAPDEATWRALHALLVEDDAPPTAEGDLFSRA